MHSLESGKLGDGAVDTGREERDFIVACCIRDDASREPCRGIGGRHGDARQHARTRVGDDSGNRSGAALRECRERHKNREQQEKSDGAKILRTVHVDS